jgi:hypothetical protein
VVQDASRRGCQLELHSVEDVRPLLEYPYINEIKVLEFTYKYSTNVSTAITRIPYCTALKLLLCPKAGSSN